MELINYILSLTVIGEVCHPRSKLAGYSTDTNNPRYAGSLINREYKKLNVDLPNVS